MNPSSKVITGPLHLDNKGACDWGPQGFLAYGCHVYTVIVDPKTLQVIQTVGPQKGNVTVVRWSREDHHHAFATGSTYCLHVAIADVTCSVAVWDVTTGQLRAELLDSGTGKPVIDLDWVTGHSESHDLLAVLRCPDTLELWDAFSGVRLWQKVFTDRLTSLSLDPFSINRLLLLCESPQVLLCSDISATKKPSDNHTVVTFTDPIPVSSALGSKRKVSSGSLPRNSSSLSKMASFATNMILNTPDSNKKRNSEDDSDTMSSCLQAVFSLVHQHTVVLLFPGEIHFLDVNVQMTMHTIRLDRSSPSLRRIHPCHTVDMLLCLHENGSVTVRVRTQTNTPTGELRSGEQLYLGYELRCHSDSLRLLRHCKVLSFTCHPVTEQQVALVLSDSRVILLDIMTTQYSPKQEPTGSVRPSLTLSDATHGHTIMPNAGLCAKSPDKVTLQMVVSGLLSGVASTVTIVTMMPATVGKHALGQHVAVGSDHGTLQLVNTYSGQVDCEYKLFVSAVCGIEPINHYQLLVYSNPEQPSYTQRKVKSEILMLNLNSGQTSSLYDTQDAKGPILVTKVSPSRVHAVILYRNKPLEFWNVTTKQLVREIVVDTLLKPLFVTWYNHVSWTGKQMQIVDSNGRTMEVRKRVMVEQLFVSGQMSDNSCMVRLSFYDSMLQNEYSIQTDKLFSPQAVSKMEIVCMTWQDHYLVLADRAGQLFIANGKSLKTGGVICERRGGNEVHSIQFGPGKRNLRFLVYYTDSVYIWELIEEPLSAIMLTSNPALMFPLVSVTWAGPDSVVMATQDSILHVTELGCKQQSATPTTPDSDDFFLVREVSMKHKTSPVKKWQLTDLFSPALMEPKLAFLLKYSLQTNVSPFSEEIQTFINLIERDAVKYLQSESTCTADRCLTVARLFGDEFDMKFWQLVKYACQTGKHDSSKLKDITRQYDSSELFSQINQSESSSDLIDLSTSASIDHDIGGGNQGDDLHYHDNKSSPNDLDISWLQDADMKSYLTSAFGEMMNNSHFKTYETSKLLLHNHRRGSSVQVKDVCSRRSIMTGKTDMAVQVLMETDTESDVFRSDCLKACLASCVQQTSTSLSTIKLAATHMIAAGYLTDGVELLCLIDRRLDACKYLISDGKWQDAVWLAKTSLQETECLGVMIKWAEHLWNNNQKSKAVLVMISQGQYMSAVQLLSELRQYDTAALFLQSCVEHGLVNISEQTDCVYVEFSKLLMVTGYQSAIEHYCHLARDRGDNFLADIKQ